MLPSVASAGEVELGEVAVTVSGVLIGVGGVWPALGPSGGVNVLEEIGRRPFLREKTDKRPEK